MGKGAPENKKAQKNLKRGNFELDLSNDHFSCSLLEDGVCRSKSQLLEFKKLEPKVRFLLLF